MQKPGQRATTKSMAAAAGVSVATVSRALNGSPLVDPATRDRVLAVAARMHYRPNLAAKGLSLGRSRVLALATSRLGGDFFGNLVAGFTRLAAQHGHDVILLVPGDRAAVQRAVLERSAEGIAYLYGGDDTPDIAGIRSVAIPRVVVNKEFADVPWVRTDYAGAVREAVGQRRQAGFDRCRFVGADPAHSSSSSLLDGYRQAVAGHPGWTPIEYGADETAVDQAVAAWRPGDLTVFARPLHFLRFYRAFRRHGLAMPVRSELLCFDQAPAMAYLDLRFSVIPQDVVGLGCEAARLLLRQLGVDAGVGQGMASGSGILLPARAGSLDDEPIPA